LGLQVRALLGLEREIEEALNWQLERASAHPELQAALARIQHGCRTRGQDLDVYLSDRDSDSAVPPSALVPLLAEARSAEMLSRVLCVDAAAFGFAASEYAVLTELALRLYDPSLRELAPRHLAQHTQAVRSLNHLLGGVVVEELDARGMDCRCICPMCGIGACGCTIAGCAWISEAWSPAQPDLDERPGLGITPPRSGSPLAAHGVRGGDRLVAIDGQPITATGFDAVREIQAAIRKHEIGAELSVTIAHGSAQPRELRVRHISDYGAE
jgi:PDZ domain